MGKLQFHNVMRQRMEQVSKVLGTVFLHMQKLTAYLHERPDDTELDSLRDEFANVYDSYVMADQRRLHHYIFGDAPEEDEVEASPPTVQLF